MTTIRASCTICGDVELTVDDVEVHFCETTSVGEYAFDCPRCDYAVRREAEPRIIDLLVASGVRLVNWEVPAEALERRDGAPLTHDDLMDFHAMLLDDSVMAEAMERLREDHRR